MQILLGGFFRSCTKYYIQLFSELESEHSIETGPEEDLMYKSTRMDEYIETLYYHLPNKVDHTNIQQEKDLLVGKNKWGISTSFCVKNLFFQGTREKMD